MLTQAQVSAARVQIGLDKAPTAPSNAGVGSSSLPANSTAPTTAPITPTSSPSPTIIPGQPQNTWDRTATANSTPAGQTSSLPTNTATPTLPSWYNDIDPQAAAAAHLADREAGAAAAGHALPENDPRMNGIQQGVANNIIPTVTDAAIDYGKNVGHDFMSGTQTILNNDAEDAGGQKSDFNTKLQNTGEFAKMVFSPITNAINPVIQRDAAGLENNKTFQDAANSSAGGAVETVQDKVKNITDQIAQAHPELAKNTDALVNIGNLIAGEFGGPEVSDTTAGLVNKGTEAIAPVVQKVADAVAAPVEMLKNRSAAADVAAGEKAAGQVVQGVGSDIPAAKNALTQIKIPENPTYQNLTESLDAKIKSDSELLDQAADTNPTKTKLSDLDQTVKVGDETINKNPIRDALTQMSDYYKKIGNVDEYAKVKTLETKAINEGLTIKEINQIARDQGKLLPGFNVNGELATGLNKKAFELTRSGVKDVARKLYGDPSLEAMDSQISDTIKTRDLIADVADKVQKAKQKIPTLNWYQKGGALIGRGAAALDTILGGAPSAFVKKFLGFAKDGQGSLDPIGLEKALKDNLNRIQKLTDSKTTGAEAENILKQMVADNKADTTPLPKNKEPVAPVEKGTLSTQTVSAMDLKRSPLPKNIRVNDYRSQFPKYLTEDQINAATDLLNAKQQAGKTIDMKVINDVVKQVKQVEDIKKPAGNYYSDVQLPKELEKQLKSYAKPATKIPVNVKK